jgi:hypothetical protein
MSAAMSGQNNYADANMMRAMQTPWAPPVPPLSKPIDLAGFAEFAPPLVTSATGLGAGGGVGVGNNSAADYGHLRVFVGLAPAGTGIINLAWGQFPAAPVAFFCDWASLVVTGTVNSIVTWTAFAPPLVTSSRPLRIDWRWTAPV